MRAVVLIVVLAAPSLNCQSALDVARLGADSDAADPSTPPVSTPDAQATAEGGGACEPQNCRGRPAACGNCVDDDNDGLVDALDPDCWGACDDSEVTWGHRMVCSNESCYFDRDCGFGNDEGCAALVPNGCDCHGCCEVSGRSTPVWLGTFGVEGEPTCAADVVNDPQACASCNLDATCFNPCDAEEVCFGPD